MTKIQEWWLRTSVWNKIERTLGFVGGISLIEIGINDAPGWIIAAIGVAFVLSKVVDIWIEDKDGDGKVDPL
jgi:hypothetical protein